MKVEFKEEKMEIEEEQYNLKTQIKKAQIRESYFKNND